MMYWVVAITGVILLALGYYLDDRRTRAFAVTLFLLGLIILITDLFLAVRPEVVDTILQ